MVKAVRIYYTTFDEEEHTEVVKKIKEISGLDPIQHPSNIKEFRYVELKLKNDVDDTFLEALRKEIRKMLGESAYIRVDYINV